MKENMDKWINLVFERIRFCNNRTRSQICNGSMSLFNDSAIECLWKAALWPPALTPTDPWVCVVRDH